MIRDSIIRHAIWRFGFYFIAYASMFGNHPQKPIADEKDSPKPPPTRQEVLHQREYIKQLDSFYKK